MTGISEPRRLSVLQAPVALTPALLGPLVGAPLGERLHLFTGQPASEAQHMAIDASGAVVVAPHPLGLPTVHAAASAGKQLLLVCAGRGSDGGKPVLARIDPSGSVSDRTDLEVTGTLQHWPQPAYVDDEATVVWASDGELWLCSWRGRMEFSPTHLERPSHRVVGLDVAPGARGALIAYHSGTEAVELRHLRRGLLDASRSVAGPGRVGLARPYASGAEWWLVWQSDGDSAPRLQRFDQALQPLGPLKHLIRPAAGERVRDIRLAIADQDRIAVTVELATPHLGPVIEATPGRVVRAQAQRLRQLIAAVSPDGTVSQFAQLAEADTGVQIAAWLGARLVTVASSRPPVVEVLAFAD